MTPQKKRLGELLIEEGILTPDQLEIALLEQKNSPGREPLGKILVQLGFVTEEVIRDQLGRSLGQESVDLKTWVPDAEALKLIDQETARRLRVVPVAYNAEAGTLKVAMADVFDIVTLDRLSVLLGGRLEIEPVLAGEAELEEAIDRFYGYELSLGGILRELETGEQETELGLEGERYSHPLVRLVDALLADAVRQGASDIHFEPEEGFLRIRYRIDGVLHQVRVLHKRYWSGMLVRLKVMAQMNIAETRSPQDGHIQLTVAGRDIDFRTATHPTLHGENLVLRILDKRKGIVPLDRLDVAADTLALLKAMAGRPEGLLLVTGPTGSGKTTTLYSLLAYINNERVNIMTLEDPVEYPLPGARQSSLNPAAKLDFAGGIRSLLRQDPDVILVGEIRDQETATMALRAAMTGHQVFSTLHTNSAVGALVRLRDIGVSTDLIAGNLIGVIAQRLVRRLCAKCRRPVTPSLEDQARWGWEPDEARVIYEAGRCAACQFHGYRGRTLIMEVIPFDAELDALVAKGASMPEIEQAARRKGYRSLAEDGLRQVAAGVTSLAEVRRVTNLNPAG
ncbi:type IV pilus assembly protein PilB [Methylomarinovum caldicuralii]|uniref:Type IV pilus assembly protein PilB n=1 Tax=Methylomarinovum caldicuralii TaxID=438856 RepID=A0AAU9CKV9_9GAMM|nr:GspE/PulE family protein [Methylomarinovum caldicuralii]BCX80468.1 type IV pilus assembly protein PilB [Methylomarinovum caldicuralii]